MTDTLNDEMVELIPPLHVPRHLLVEVEQCAAELLVSATTVLEQMKRADKVHIALEQLLDAHPTTRLSDDFWATLPGYETLFETVMAFRDMAEEWEQTESNWSRFDNI